MGRKDKQKHEEQADTEVGSAVSLARLERLARLMRQSGHGEGLNPAQWEALRYLSRANRLSNSPGSLARYLGSTKGTISQTLASLVSKGLVAKQMRGEDNRFVDLLLTEKGRAVLEQDGLRALGLDIGTLRPKIRKRFDRGLEELLSAQVQRQGEPSFGTCPSCRYFREATSSNAASCMKINAELAVAELGLLCVEHVGR